MNSEKTDQSSKSTQRINSRKSKDLASLQTF